MLLENGSEFRVVIVLTKDDLGYGEVLMRGSALGMEHEKSGQIMCF